MREGILKEMRLGKFGVPYHLIVGEHNWFLSTLTRHIAIIGATNVSYEEQIVYTGISNLFEEITKDEDIPWYKIEVSNIDHSIKSVVRQGYRAEKTQETKPAFSGEEIAILKGLIEEGNIT